MNPVLISQAVTILNAGGLVAFPTETVYGLGADATNEAAVHKIFQAKKRPYHHPLIVHIQNIEEMQHWASEIPQAAFKLAHLFWPGPLTMILKKKPQVLDIVTAQQNTLGLRIPNHPVAQALLKAFGRGIAAPSANRFTHISPTTSQAVFEELGNKADLILEGGSCQVGVESTIIDMTHEPPIMMRPGMITVDVLNQTLGMNVLCKDKKIQRSPGMHAVHYAPTTKTRLVDGSAVLQTLHHLPAADLPAAILIRSALDLPVSANIKLVKMPADAKSYAHYFYHTLRSIDQQQLKCIMIETVPDEIEWDGIRDRILKATASR